jgi:hypothetical protein
MQRRLRVFDALLHSSKGFVVRGQTTIALLFGVTLVLAVPTGVRAVSLWPHSLQPHLYIVEGYLDRAPNGADITDRIGISAHGRRRTLLITSYGPGEIMLEHYLSQVMIEPYSLQGTDEEVSSIIDAPPGTRISGTFAAYTDGSPWLLIANLISPDTDSPNPNSHGGRRGS